MSKITEISEALRDSIKSNLTSKKAIKLLFDLERSIGIRKKPHMKAREISGKYLQELLVAVIISQRYYINNRLEGESFENECFFTQEQHALDWLRRK